MTKASLLKLRDAFYIKNTNKTNYSELTESQQKILFGKFVGIRLIHNNKRRNTWTKNMC